MPVTRQAYGLALDDQSAPGKLRRASSGSLAGEQGDVERGKSAGHRHDSDDSGPDRAPHIFTDHHALATLNLCFQSRRAVLPEDCLGKARLLCPRTPPIRLRFR